MSCAVIRGRFPPWLGFPKGKEGSGGRADAAGIDERGVSDAGVFVDPPAVEKSEGKALDDQQHATRPL
jgi:hypothetical protein